MTANSTGSSWSQTVPAATSKPACTPSRYNLPCALCVGPIIPGDLMFPIAVNHCSDHEGGTSAGRIGKGKKRSGLVWAHECCGGFFGRNGTPTPPPCRHWLRLGRCPVKDAGLCAFHHDEVRNGTSLSHTEDAKDSSVSDAPRKKKWGGRRAVVRNDHKNAVFRAFLIQTYGLDFLRFGGHHSVYGDENKKSSPSIILDVAGGKGELSWELVNLMGVESVVVDPRGPLTLHSMDRRWRRGMYEPRRTGPVFQKWCPAVEEGSSLNREPRHPLLWRSFFNAEAFVRLAGMGENTAENAQYCRYVSEKDTFGPEAKDISFDAEDWLRKEQARAKAIRWTTKGLTHEDEVEEEDLDHSEKSGSFNTQEKEMSQENMQGESSFSTNSTPIKVEEDEMISAKDARDLLQRCSLVVGLHPDQAVGDIVAFADRMGLPWCVVPCCVYSKLFTKRRLKDGSDVRTYEQLVQWLCERYPTARVATLEFEGKNRVVYTLPVKIS